MAFLPVVGREFRCATHRRRTYWVRLGTAAAAAAVGVVAICKVQSGGASTTVGRTLFETLAGISFSLSLVAGVFTTSMSVSEERRLGTLGLLFLTDLKGYELVAGKLASATVNSIQTLMAIFPVLSLAMVLGGVSVGEFWRMALVLCSTLLFSLSTGILVSALSVRRVRAMAATVALLALLAGPSALVDEYVFDGLRVAGTKYLMPGPFQAYALVWDNRSDLLAKCFLPSILCTLAISAGQLALASRWTSRGLPGEEFTPWPWKRREIKGCPDRVE